MICFYESQKPRERLTLQGRAEGDVRGGAKVVGLYSQLLAREPRHSSDLTSTDRLANLILERFAPGLTPEGRSSRLQLRL
jgi:hypothetical protein